MTLYLLDTDICSYLAQDYSLPLQQHFLSVPSYERAISAITYAEILIGIHKKKPEPRRLRQIGLFLQNIEVLPWTADVASTYAELTERLRPQPIGEHDTMIAAHAITLDATLVTNNTRHFSRIGPPLRMENWLE